VESPLLHIDDDQFRALTEASRDLHGHMFVLPVAVWILFSDVSVVSVAEVLRGLDGRVDRHRIIEALGRLDLIGAMKELPRLGARNSPRAFEKLPGSPYWQFVASYSAERASVGR
jgi:hypothetical protein